MCGVRPAGAGPCDACLAALGAPATAPARRPRRLSPRCSTTTSGAATSCVALKYRNRRDVAAVLARGHGRAASTAAEVDLVTWAPTSAARRGGPGLRPVAGCWRGRSARALGRPVRPRCCAASPARPRPASTPARAPVGPDVRGRSPPVAGPRARRRRRGHHRRHPRPRPRSLRAAGAAEVHRRSPPPARRSSVGRAEVDDAAPDRRPHAANPPDEVRPPMQVTELQVQRSLAGAHRPRRSDDADRDRASPTPGVRRRRPTASSSGWPRRPPIRDDRLAEARRPARDRRPSHRRGSGPAHGRPARLRPPALSRSSAGPCSTPAAAEPAGTMVAGVEITISSRGAEPSDGARGRHPAQDRSPGPLRRGHGHRPGPLRRGDATPASPRRRSARW